jgi:LuxR family maltose regulon positive regulatory protein
MSDPDRHQGGAGPGGPVLLATKLRPPRTRAQTLLRAHLLGRLRAGRGHKVTLVAGPAGFGKTTLLAAWYEADAARHPVGWVTLDERDDDPVVLWSYVLAALRRAGPGLESVGEPQLAGAASVVDAVLPRLINALDRLGDVTLILDDFHRLGRGAARDSVGWFIEHAPPAVRVVLATRREPALNLAALRARGELLELRVDDLRFSPAEAAEFLNARLGLGLAPADVAGLVDRTEGWPAGLYLAALSLAGAADRHAFVAGFGASHRHVVDFLSREVLDTHPPVLQALMLRASILESVCGPLGDALLERSGTAALLDELARTNLFLLPLDDRREWFRFHHLFAELLRVELGRRDPALVPRLHRRASRWYRDHAMPDPAIDHALAAGAFAEAAALLEASWTAYMNVCRHASVLAWVDRFPDEVLRSRAPLLLVKAWVLALSGRAAEAARVAALVDAVGDPGEGPLPDGLSSVGASVTLLRAVFPAGDVGAQLANGLRAEEAERPGSPWRAVACWAVGMGAYLQGRPDEADRWFAESVARAPEGEQWLAAGSSLAYRSLLAGDQGRAEDQRRLAEEAAAFAAAHDVDAIDGEIPLARGVALAAGGRPAAALPLLEAGLGVIRAWGQPLDTAHALLRLVPVLRALGQGDRAAAAVAEARTLVGACPDPGVLGARLAALERPARPAVAPGDALSPTERRILRLLAGTLTEREIGAELFLTRNTVHTHVTAIYRKLGVASRAAALARARELGLARPADAAG